MFDNSNSYILRTEIVENTVHYYVSFIDGQAVRQNIEVSHSVYLELCRSVKQERNLKRSDERHLERSGLTDETLHNRTLNQSKSIEEIASDNMRSERLRQAIAGLPETQRRRFILYHEFGLNYAQIAGKEGCTARAVEYSVTIAQEKIKKFFKI